MIKGCCKTNLDEYRREEWPQFFVAVPQVGECVLAKSGKLLKVCRVTHMINYNPNTALIGFGSPYIEVELTKTV